MSKSLHISVEKLDANGHYDQEARIVLSGTLEPKRGNYYEGSLEIIGARGRDVLISIPIGGTIKFGDEVAELDLTADFDMDGDIFTAPVPTPVKFHALVGFKSEEGKVLSFTLPWILVGTLQHTAENVYMGEVDRFHPDPDPERVDRAGIQLTLPA